MKFFVIEINVNGSVFGIGMDSASGGYPYVTDCVNGYKFRTLEYALSYFDDYRKEVIPTYNIPNGLVKGIMEVSLIEVNMESYLNVCTEVVYQIARYIGK